MRYFYMVEEMEKVFRSQELEYPSQYSLDELVSRMKQLNHLKIDLKIYRHMLLFLDFLNF